MFAVFTFLRGFLGHQVWTSSLKWYQDMKSVRTWWNMESGRVWNEPQAWTMLGQFFLNSLRSAKLLCAFDRMRIGNQISKHSNGCDCMTHSTFYIPDETGRNWSQCGQILTMIMRDENDVTFYAFVGVLSMCKSATPCLSSLKQTAFSYKLHWLNVNTLSHAHEKVSKLWRHKFCFSVVLCHGHAWMSRY